MTTPYPHAAKFGPEKFYTWNPATQQEVLPVTVYVYAVGTTNRSTLYTDKTRATPLANNPLPIGVVPVAGVTLTNDAALPTIVGGALASKTSAVVEELAI